jgi:hypothetical protein
MLAFLQPSADIPQLIKAGKAILGTIFPQEIESGIAAGCYQDIGLIRH